MKTGTKRVVVPRTEAEWSAYRCQLSCKVGRDALEGKTKLPAGVSPLEYAVFNLLHAIEELSRQEQIKLKMKHENRN